MSFSDLGLSEKVLTAVSAAGYSEPTPIQSEAIPHILQRRDLIGIAQTGTGKTAAFTLPMLTLLESGRARARMPRTLILEPTRELAAQVEENFSRYGTNHKLNLALIIGGVSFGDQDTKINRGVDVLIATPGRLLDHIERGKLLLTGIEILVIDEADRMLDMGFIPDIERICKLVPFTRQTLFFSATMPPEIKRLTENFLSNPVRVEVARPASAAATITQRLIATGGEAHEKREALRQQIAQASGLKNAIVFCNRKRDVAVVFRSLIKHGLNVGSLHGDMDQSSRTQTLDKFRSGEITLLVASDVAARGLDIPDVSHVFNYDVPHHAEDYVHRIGRTGRAGRAGHAAMLVTSADSKTLATIEQLIGTKIEWEGSSTPPASENEPATRSRQRRGYSEDHPGEPSQGRGERSGRSASRRGKGRDSTGDRAIGPKDAASERPADSGVAPRRERHDERPARQSAPAVTKERPAQRPRRSDTNEVHKEPRGLGDHVPAFLLRAVRPR